MRGQGATERRPDAWRLGSARAPRNRCCARARGPSSRLHEGRLFKAAPTYRTLRREPEVGGRGTMRGWGLSLKARSGSTRTSSSVGCRAREPVNPPRRPDKITRLARREREPRDRGDRRSSPTRGRGAGAAPENRDGAAAVRTAPPPKPSARTRRRPRRSRGCARGPTRPRRDGGRGPSRGESDRAAPDGRGPRRRRSSTTRCVRSGRARGRRPSC